MSTRGVDELVMRAVQDGEFRQRMESNLEGVFSEFDLTSEEQEAVRRVQQRLSLGEIEPEKIGATMNAVPMASWL